MRIRQQLPVSSPVSLAALGAGAVAVLSGGPTGAVTAWLRERFCARVVQLTDSGTSALALALESVAAFTGRPRVALPAYGCYDLATAADAAGAEVLLYDLDPNTLSPDGDSLKQVIDQGVGAVVIAHFYGQPADFDRVRPLIEAGGALLVEDAAQGAGGEYAGRALGALGSISVLSFGRGKGVTGGAGGALLGIDEPGMAALEAGPRKHLEGGRGTGTWLKLVGLWALGRPAIYGIPAALPFLRLGETVYHAPWPPRGMAASSAGVLSRTLLVAGAEATNRRAHAERLRRRLEGHPSLRTFRAPSGAIPGYLRLALLASEPARLAADSPSARALGIMPGYPVPLARLPGFEPRVLNRAGPFPGAETLAARLITLPVHGALEELDLRRLEAWIDVMRTRVAA